MSMRFGSREIRVTGRDRHRQEVRQIPCSRYKRDVRPEHERKPWPEITYDTEVDMLYIVLARVRVERTKDAGPFAYDLDIEGHVVGIEIPVGEQGAGGRRLEKSEAAGRKRAEPPQLAERHRGFIFIKRFSPRDVELR